MVWYFLKEYPQPEREGGARLPAATSSTFQPINLTVMLRPYSREALANIATSTAKTSDRLSFFRQSGPYAM